MVLVLVVACRVPAWAAPAFAQAAACGTAATRAFVGAPTNGDVVTGSAVGGAITTSSTMKDSNTVSYAQKLEAETVTNMVMWSGTVSGSPTATYTYSAGSNNICQWDMSGVQTTGTYTQATQTTGTTVVATLAGVKSGDLEICVAENAGNVITGIATSNGTYASDSTNTNTIRWGHTTATSTASSTCTLTSTNNTSGATVFFASFTAPVSAFGLYPAEGAYPGGVSFIPAPDWKSLCRDWMDA